MKGGRNLLWLLPLIFVGSIPVWWGAVAGFLTPRGGFDPGPVRGKQIKSFSMQDVFLTQSKEGVEEFTLRAERIFTAEKEDVLQMETVEARIIGAKKKQTDVKSGEAVYDTQKQILTLIDDVNVQTADGHHMQTEAMRYLTKYKTIKTAAEVRMNGTDMNAEGTSLSYNLDSGAFRVGGRVKVDLQEN